MTTPIPFQTPPPKSSATTSIAIGLFVLATILGLIFFVDFSGSDSSDTKLNVKNCTGALVFVAPPAILPNDGRGWQERMESQESENVRLIEKDGQKWVEVNIGYCGWKNNWQGSVNAVLSTRDALEILLWEQVPEWTKVDPREFVVKFEQVKVAEMKPGNLVRFQSPYPNTGVEIHFVFTGKF